MNTNKITRAIYVPIWQLEKHVTITQINTNCKYNGNIFLKLKIDTSINDSKYLCYLPHNIISIVNICNSNDEDVYSISSYRIPSNSNYNNYLPNNLQYLHYSFPERNIDKLPSGLKEFSVEYNLCNKYNLPSLLEKLCLNNMNTFYEIPCEKLK